MGEVKRTITVALMLVGVLGIAACGGSDHGDSMGGGHMESSGHHSDGTDNRPVAPGARRILVTADSLTFVPRRIELRAGEDVAIVLTSKDLEHDLYVESVGHIVHARAGATEEGGLSIDEPGSYRMWCTVRGHREGGMVGTVTVRA
jgi:plastocyanin